MKIFHELMDMLEEYYLDEIFRIRSNKDIRNNVKLAKLESIRDLAVAYKLPVAFKMAENGIERILKNE